MMKPYVDSPATEEIRHSYLRFTNLTVLRESLIKKLYPNSDGTLSSVALKDLSLPISPNKVLSEKKIASIRMKINMFVSPAQRDYYPEIKCSEDYVVDTEGEIPTLKKQKGKKKREYSILDDKKTQPSKRRQSTTSSAEKSLSGGQLSLANFFRMGVTPGSLGSKSESTKITNDFLSPTTTVSTTLTNKVLTKADSLIDMSDENTNDIDCTGTVTNQVNLEIQSTSANIQVNLFGTTDDVFQKAVVTTLSIDDDVVVSNGFDDRDTTDNNIDPTAGKSDSDVVVSSMNINNVMSTDIVNNGLGEIINHYLLTLNDAERYYHHCLIGINV